MRSSLRPVSMSSAMQFNRSGILVKPGEKLCPTCRKRCTDAEESQDFNDDDFVPTCVQKATLDSSLVELGCSPMKTCGVGDRASYGKRKLNTITQVMSDKVAKVLEIPGGADALLGIENPVEKDCEDCSDFRLLIQELKDKCRISTNREKVRLLTMAPTSWSIEKVAEELGVTQYLVKKSRKLYKDKGKLCHKSQ